MAAVSTAHATTTASSATALTPPSSSHGNGYAWESSHQPLEEPAYNQRPFLKSQPSSNGSILAYGSPNTSSGQLLHGKASAAELLTATSKTADYAASHHGYDNLRQGRPRDASNGLGEAVGDVYDGGRHSAVAESNKRAAAVDPQSSGELDDASSKWIHRDKLARIESEELQAAGIILPKSRARSRPRRDMSVDKAASHRRGAPEADAAAEPRSRKNSAGLSDRRLADTPGPSWDLRLPEEIAEESYFASPSGARGVSRIPVAKQSPAPIALEHMERDTLMPRRRDDSPSTEDSIAYPKPRSRSASIRPAEGGAGPGPAADTSPKKPSGGGLANGGSAATGSRKTSAATRTSATAGRPKTRNGSSKDSNSSGGGAARPSTRSGERDLSREYSSGATSKQPEGEPPWMISAYRPDPRLPPDQQLLPTVARRLQQEKWEREGKFGNVYDKEFRPLTDEGFVAPPDKSEKPTAAPTAAAPEPTAPTTAAAAAHKAEKQDEWPLKPEARSPTNTQGRTGSYSTIPKIQDKANMSPLPSPRGPLQRMPEAGAAQPASASRDDDRDKTHGCGCCTIM